MSGVLRFVHLLALGVWIGTVVFFSFVVAPALFAVLGPAHAGDVVGVIFPRYYALGTGSAVTALGCALALGRTATARGRWRGAAGAVALGLAVTLWAGLVVAPRAQRLRATLQARGEEPGADEEFRRLHGLAVALNGTALLAALTALGLSAAALRQ